MPTTVASLADAVALARSKSLLHSQPSRITETQDIVVNGKHFAVAVLTFDTPALVSGGLIIQASLPGDYLKVQAWVHHAPVAEAVGEVARFGVNGFCPACRSVYKPVEKRRKKGRMVVLTCPECGHKEKVWLA